MELDEIKKIWAEMESLKTKIQISDNRIKEMLKKEGKSALAKLIRISKFFIFIYLPFGLLFCLCSYQFFETGGYYIISPLSFILICLFMTIFEIFMCRMLKSINFSTMTVKDVSEKILKYRNIVQKMQIYSTYFMIFFMLIWLFLYYKLAFGTEIHWGFIIYCIVLLLISIYLIQYLYNKLYYKNIKKIQESLDELKVFEN
jgi:hypothetical protein